MDACLEAGVDYLDTANYEPPDVAKFEYKWQWAYQERFAKAGRMALLGSGFDPGVTNVFCAYVAEAPARRDPLRRHRRLQRRLARQGVRDQLQPRDQHPRDHRARPLLGERRVEGDRPAQRVEDLRLPRRRRAQELPPLSRGARVAREEPQGPQAHPVLDDVRRGVPQAPRGAAERRHDAHRRGRVRGQEDRPDQVPAARCCRIRRRSPPSYTGKTSIGCLVRGHQGRQARSATSSTTSATTPRPTRKSARRPISYTTGVPAVTGAVMMVTGKWKGAGVFNMEQLDPDPFLEDVAQARPALARRGALGERRRCARRGRRARDRHLAASRRRASSPTSARSRRTSRSSPTCSSARAARSCSRSRASRSGRRSRSCGKYLAGATVELGRRGAARARGARRRGPRLRAGVLRRRDARARHARRSHRAQLARAVAAASRAIERRGAPDVDLGGLRVNHEHQEVEVALYDPAGAVLAARHDAREPRPPRDLDGIDGLHFHTLCQVNSDALERALAAFEQQVRRASSRA